MGAYFLNGNGQGGAAPVHVPVNGEGNVPGGIGEFPFRPVEEDGVTLHHALAHEELQMVGSHALGRLRGEDVGAHEEGLGVGVAEGFQLFIAVQQIHGQGLEGDFHVYVLHRAALFLRGGLRNIAVEGPPEVVHAGFLNHQARRHVMAAAGNQSVRALMDGLHEGDAGDGTPGALAHPAFIKGDDEGRLVVPPHELGSHNAHHAGMPRAGA